MFFCEKEKRWCSVWSCKRSKCEFSGEGREADLYKKAEKAQLSLFDLN